MYGIPNMKLDKSVIERRRKLMEAEGVVFKTGVNVGKKEAEELQKEFDAVILACGAKQPRGLTAVITQTEDYKETAPETGQQDKDRDKSKDKWGKTKAQSIDHVEGVYYAVDFLTGCTRALLSGRLDLRAKDKNVVIVGGGDTGNDCIGTVLRQGCSSVTAIEMMPAPPLVRAESNSWPEWPKVMKTDYGHTEAIARFGADPRIFSTTVKELILKKGALHQICTIQVAFKDGKLREVEGTEKTIPCDLLLIAAGFTGCQQYTAEAFGVKLTSRGTVASEDGPDHYRTNVSGVFTAGDMHRGQSLVVWNIVEGRGCAREVDEYLMGYTML
jgi:glutamate synthase (NADPH/NADH) small chain